MYWCSKCMKPLFRTRVSVKYHLKKCPVDKIPYTIYEIPENVPE